MTGKRYAICACVSWNWSEDANVERWSYKQVPTFYLDPAVQGIVNEDHAAEIATEILNPHKLKTIRVSLNATLVD